MNVKPPASPEVPWQHAQLQSGGPNPARISVDYQHKPVQDGDEFKDYAGPVWLNVERPDLKAGDQVRAVWNVYPVSNGDRPVSGNEVDLSYAGGGRFTAQLPDALEQAGSLTAGGQNYRQQLSVVANGDWLKDPISNTNNFGLKLTNGS